MLTFAFTTDDKPIKEGKFVIYFAFSGESNVRIPSVYSTEEVTDVLL